MVTGVFIPLIGGTAAQYPERFEARSATYWPELINTPLLIQHGEADWRVLPEESIKLAAGLEKNAKVYNLITYPGDDHGLSAHNMGLYEIFSWLAKYFDVSVNLDMISRTSTSNLSDTPPGELDGNTFINAAKAYQVSGLPFGYEPIIPASPMDLMMTGTRGWMGVGAFAGETYTETFFNGVNAWWVPAITQKYSQENVTVIEDTEITISGYRAKKVTFTYVTNGKNYIETTYHIWRPNNDFKLYRIRLNCLQADLEQMTKTFEDFVAGFTFL
jgi:hypothetical protein